MWPYKRLKSMALAVVWSNKRAKVNVGKMKRLWSMVKGMEEDILALLLLLLRLMLQIKFLRCERAKIKYSRHYLLLIFLYSYVSLLSYLDISDRAKKNWTKTFARSRFPLYSTVWQSFLVSFSFGAPPGLMSLASGKNNTTVGCRVLWTGAGSDWIIVGTSAAALQCPVPLHGSAFTKVYANHR